MALRWESDVQAEGKERGLELGQGGLVLESGLEQDWKQAQALEQSEARRLGRERKQKERG